ncbi:CxxC motif-containing protein [Eubacterium aggregans]|uniref:CxxC motif-containing protein n=2 Tax=Eubacterium aggregans TaxID=81409 RepID=A0A1H4E0E1_9FIRM|nr:CxxC motif-containing protein [Eubacterium aggregans]
MKKTITCISCPMGCQITATIEAGVVTAVEGNTCARGEKYARKEVISPMRIVTSTVKVDGGELAMVSVKTASDIPKGEVENCVWALKGLCVQAPVSIGQIILENVAGTGVSIIATKEIGVS